MTNNLTGYGPSSRLLFDGDERKYELWEIKFLGYLRLKKLSDTILTPLAEDANEVTTAADATKNADAFAELIQCLDDRSLTLVIRDAINDGRKALAILREHYRSKGKPRIITLYTQLTSLKMSAEENITDYVLRAETASTSLKTAGETISDSLLIAMILKGLPQVRFKPFSTVVTQKDKALSFGEFKVALRSFEETEKLSTEASKEDSVMKVILCYGCGKPGHKLAECRVKKKRWCDICKSNTHQTEKCRKKNHVAKSVSETKNDNMHEVKQSFVFKVGINVASKQNVNGLLVDCGATTHIVHDLTKFIRFDKEFNPEDHYIELADGSRSNNVALKRGDACVQLCDVDGNVHQAILTNALYVPSYRQNIFSVQAATSKGTTVCFSSDDAKLIYPNGTKFKIEKSGNLYYLNRVVSSSMAKQNSKTKSLRDWHEILGHCNLKDVLALEGVVDGMKVADKREFDCDVCVMGKMIQSRNREPDRRASKILQLVHCDLAGPIQPAAKDGFRYAISFTDDFSGIIMIYFIRQKSDTVSATEKFLADLAPYGKVKCLRSDNGTEFTSESFQNLLLKHSIKHEKSAPYSPHQNGTAERGWRSIFEMARCLLIHAALPKNLWSYAAMCAVYIRNRCYNHRLKKTPFEAFTGHKPNLEHMHTFGTICYAYVQEKKKLDARGEKGIFVGYDKGSPANLIYYPESGVIRKSRCVRFTDKFETEENAECSPNVSCDVPCQTDPQPGEGDNQGLPNSPTNDPGGNTSDSGPSVNSSQNENVQTSTMRYPSREREKPKYLGHVDDNNVDEKDNISYTVHYCYCMSDVPKTYQQAISSPDSCKWQTAMEEEMQALRENDTFELTPLPEGRKTVGGRWVYAIKQGPNGEEKHKARFVAKGYSQVAEIDYHETFSPTANLTSIRILIQLAVQFNLTVHQMDVKSAYLNAPIDCELFVEQPEGFTIASEDGKHLVCKLKKSLYGLKQSGRNWNSVLHSYLVSEGFTQSQADYCVYTKITNESLTVVVIWVDDLIIASSCTDTLMNVKKNLGIRFKMKDLGKLTWFLGLEFICEGVIKINQTQYIRKVLSRFNMENDKPRSTPCEMSASKITDDSDLANV